MWLLCDARHAGAPHGPGCLLQESLPLVLVAAVIRRLAGRLGENPASLMPFGARMLGFLILPVGMLGDQVEELVGQCDGQDWTINRDVTEDIEASRGRAAVEEPNPSGQAERLSPPRRRTNRPSKVSTALATGQPATSMTAHDLTNWFLLMMKEYEYLQAAIDKIDGQRFQIRNWTIIAAGALFTASLSAKISLIAFGGVVTTLFFALLEAIYMQLMDAVVERTKNLEDWIGAYRSKGEEPTEYVFGVGQAFAGHPFSFRKIRKSVSTRNRFHVTAFYGGLMLVTAGGAVAVMLR